MPPIDDNGAHLPPPPAHYPIHPDQQQPTVDSNVGIESDILPQPTHEQVASSEVSAELVMPKATEEVAMAADSHHIVDEPIVHEQPFTTLPQIDDPFVANEVPDSAHVPVSPRPAQPFDPIAHTQIVDGPSVQPVEHIGVDDPREPQEHPSTQPASEAVSAQPKEQPTAAETANTLTFDELTHDPTPSSPIPSVLPPNPLLADDKEESIQHNLPPSAHELQSPTDRVPFSEPKPQNKLLMPFVVAAISLGVLVLFAIPYVLSPKSVNTSKSEPKTKVTTLTNLPAGYVSVDRDCYSVPLPKDNNVNLDRSCALAGNFGPKGDGNVSILPETKTYSSSDAYYADATKKPNDLKVLSKSTIKLDGLTAIKVINDVGSQGVVQKQVNVYVTVASKGYKIGDVSIAGFEIILSYNDAESVQVAEQLLSQLKWH